MAREYGTSVETSATSGPQVSKDFGTLLTNLAQTAEEA